MQGLFLSKIRNLSTVYLDLYEIQKPKLKAYGPIEGFQDSPVLVTVGASKEGVADTDVEQSCNGGVLV